MAVSALATAFVNIVPGTVELEKYLKGELGNQAENAGEDAGKKFTAGLSKSLQNAGAKLKHVGQKMSMAITAPLVGVGIAGVKLAADFGVTMASLQINAGATAKEMENLRELALKMGADTVFSAGEAAQAMLDLSKGGMSAADIQGGALAATMNLAATEGMALADAATIITQTMNTFGIEAGAVNGAVDILAAGAVASTASVYGLAEAMKFVGSTSSTLGIDMADTVTALAMMNNAGIDSTTAGTSLNRFMLGLIPQTKKAQKAMDELGISFVNQDGTIKSMSEVIAILDAEMSDLGDAQRIAYLKQMFGVEGMRAATVLLEQGATGWAAMNEQVERQGIASELANARMSGLAGSIEQARGSIETAFLAVGDRLTPAVEALAAIVVNVTNAFASLSPEQQQVIVQVGAFLAVLGPAIIVVGQIVGSIGTLITAFTTVSAFIAANVIPKLAALWLTMSANPIGIVISIIGALVAALTYFFTQTEIGQKAWAGFMKFLEDTWRNVSKFFIDSWNNTVKFFNDIPKTFEKIGKDIIDGLIKGISDAWNGLMNFVEDVATNVGNTFKDILGIKSPSTVFYGYGENIGDGLVNGINSKIGAVQKAAQGLASASTPAGFEWVVGPNGPYLERTAVTRGVNLRDETPFMTMANQTSMIAANLAAQGLNQAQIDKVFESAVGGTAKEIANSFRPGTELVNTKTNTVMMGNIQGQQLTDLLAQGFVEVGKVAATQDEITQALRDLEQTVLSGNVANLIPMATGGFVNRPTPALIGEAGPEVVMPLSRFESIMGLNDGGSKTINYFAAPNQSLDSEQALFQAMRRAKVVAQW